ncbi:glycerol-3-phosphate dehydrogenase (NAD(P)+) [Myxococcaceae bacterium]|jgi:glycerol-3-phosphate dehydrogenase (NAD(P)+)|nr:glycerol-3-phosphate dehydrogenase (NAD(P)+) [Myxococcaceae bacterium]
MSTRVAVLGAGSFGTCLAILCGREHEVVLWARDPALAAAINQDRRNPRYLKDAEVPRSVEASADLDHALDGREIVICAVPSQGVRGVMSEAGQKLAPGAIVVSTIKGIEPGSCLTMHQVLEDVIPASHRERLVVLSGPSFAKEVAAGKPTVVTIACRHEEHAVTVRNALSNPAFRCYSNTDVLGVELGGALKNVIALAVGICDGLGLGHNSRAALMTRGLAEITRLGVKLGADPLTFLGLSGVGDLVLTCTGDLSRNRSVGLELGRGRPLGEILAAMAEVAEGVRTTYAACELAERAGVELPIAAMVREVLDGRLAPAAAVEKLMTRKLGHERP